MILKCVTDCKSVTKRNLILKTRERNKIKQNGNSEPLKKKTACVRHTHRKRTCCKGNAMKVKQIREEQVVTQTGNPHGKEGKFLK